MKVKDFFARLFYNMAKSLVWLLILCLIAFKFNNCNGGIFSWLFTNYEKSDKLKIDIDTGPPSNDPKPNNLNTQDEDISVLSVKIPFELKSSDEKFLNEVAKYTTSNLSDLDICHHKVILGLRKSCSDLTEEELSKVAVNLLNCQSFVERRKIFPCTEAMSLSDCTNDMDQNTWNAYHIISNRVRAVCYHFRQQQFTAKTEMTVNKLVHSAEEQIDAMKLLEVSQINLKDATSETLNSLKTGHQMLEKQQESLSSAQVSIRNYVSSNIKDLTREKRLIASGQKELAEITLAIKRKLEEAQKQLKDQGTGQRNTHRKILQDLSDIQDSASRVWGQIDASTKAILLKHEQTVAHYARLMEDLQKVNGTVHHLMDVLVTMKTKVEEKFSWISALVGDTDATVQKIYNFVLHICYCLLGMIASSFLQVPYATKMALIILVPLNALAEMKTGSSLEFSTLTIVLATCMFFNVSTLGAIRVYRWRKAKRLAALCDRAPSPPLSHTSEIFDDETSSKQSSTNLYELRSPTLNQREICGQMSDDEPTPDEYTSDYSFKATSFTSPLSRISEESEKRYAKYPYISLISPSPFTDSVRRRILTQTDSSSSISKETSASLNGSTISSNGLNLSRNKSLISDVSSRTPSSRSLTPKKICTSFCKNGLPCKNIASAGSSLCYRHLAGPSRESTPVG